MQNQVMKSASSHSVQTFGEYFFKEVWNWNTTSVGLMIKKNYYFIFFILKKYISKLGSLECFFFILKVRILQNQSSVENYIIFREYIKYVFPPLTEVVDPTMNLISEIHDFCEKREYVFNVFPEYSIINHLQWMLLTWRLSNGQIARGHLH